MKNSVVKVMKGLACPLLFFVTVALIVFGNYAIDVSNSKEMSPYLFKMLYLFSFVLVGITAYAEVHVCRQIAKEKLLFRLIIAIWKMVIVIFMVTFIVPITMQLGHGREVWGVIAGLQAIECVVLLFPQKLVSKLKLS